MLKIIIFLLIFCTPNLMANLFSQGGDTRTWSPNVYKNQQDWGIDISFGGNYSDGNVDFVYIATGFTAFQYFGSHYFILSADSLYQEANGNVIFDKAQGFLRYDYFLSDLWRVFIINTHAQNQFLELDYRITAGAGIWHDFFYEDIVQNGFSIAPIYNHEEFENDTDDTFELSFRNLFTWHIMDGAELALDAFFIPNALNVDDYRFFGAASIKTNVYKKMVFLQVSIQNEYDSKPQEGVQHNDFLLKTSLILHFDNNT